MNLQIHGNHIEVTPALREYVSGKLARIERHFDQVIDATVQLTVERVHQRAEITLRLRGNHIHVESVEQDMYAAIDTLVDKLDRQVLRYKDRVKDHQSDTLRRQDAIRQQQQQQ
jgi:putative sigma-54 modulation protein